jgi:hypothetical protein|nr:MAG TPA: Protein of unknown function (DUF551) [Caudoviricetes sp.]
MKQTLEEAAIKAAEDCYEMPYNENLLHMLLIKQAFELGAEWQAKQSPWISVKERLPDESEFVLCRMVSNEAIVGGYIFVSPDGLPCVATLPNFEFDDYGGYVCDMWMPIPKFN